MDGKTQYSKYGNFPQTAEQFQCHSYQNARKIFSRYRQDYSKVHIEKQRNKNT